MPWSTLPPEVLSKILSNLRFRDRVEFSLVCRQWHDVIFGLCPTDFLLPLRSYDDRDLEHLPSLLVSSTRRYRNLEVDWEESENIGHGREDMFFQYLDKVLAILAEKGSVRCLWLTAPLDQRIVRFFATHEIMLDSLEELWVTISNNYFKLMAKPNKWTPVQFRFSNLKYLKRFESENYSCETFKDFIFGLSLPSATKIKLIRSCDIESRDRSLVELTDAGNVRDMTICNLDEYCLRHYFKVKRPKLQWLCLEDTMSQMTYQTLREVAENLPNLQSLRFNMVWREFSTNLTLASMLKSLTKISMKLYGVQLSNFCKQLQDLQNLKVIHLTCEDYCIVEANVRVQFLELVEFCCDLYSINESDYRIVLNCPQISIFQQINYFRNGHPNFFQLAQVNQDHQPRSNLESETPDPGTLDAQFFTSG